MHYPDRATVCVSSQAGLRHGLLVLRHRPGRVHPPPEHRRDRRAGGRGPPGRPARPGCPTWCSWGWASRSPTTTGCGRPSCGSTTTSGLSARHLTISTVGVVPGIRRLAREALPVNLAVSLHAANDHLRDTLVPLNRRYPLAVLMEACRQYLTAKGRRLSFEWALIDGVNDRPSTPPSWPRWPGPSAPTSTSSRSTRRPGYPCEAPRRPASAHFRDQLLALGRQRHGAAQPGHRHRRRLRAAGGPDPPR